MGELRIVRFLGQLSLQVFTARQRRLPSVQQIGRAAACGRVRCGSAPSLRLVMVTNLKKEEILSGNVCGTAVVTAVTVLGRLRGALAPIPDPVQFHYNCMRIKLLSF